MKQLKALLFFTLLFCSVEFINPQTKFEKTFGGTGNEFANKGLVTTDGGFLFAGSVNSFGSGNTDGYLVKTDQNGDTIWTRTFGGTGYDQFTSTSETSDNGYIAVGFKDNGFGSNDIFVVKTDASGNLIWAKNYGGTGPDEAIGVAATNDGGGLIAGWTGSFGAGLSDFYLLRINGSGDTVWTKTIGSPISQSPKSVSLTNDNGFIITGSVYDNQTFDTDIYLVKINSDGSTAWVQSIGGTPPENAVDIGYAAIQTNDNGFLIAGTSAYSPSDVDVVLIKTDATGNISWVKRIGGIASENCQDVKQLNDGSYVVVGSTFSFSSSNSDSYIFKTDANGNLLWAFRYGSNDNDEFRSVSLKNDGFLLSGYASGLVGFGAPEMYVVLTDLNGETGCNQLALNFSSSDYSMESANLFAQVSSQAFISDANISVGFGANTSTICYTSSVDENITGEMINYQLDQNYPNPFNPSTMIKYTIPNVTVRGNEGLRVQLIVYDVLGNEIVKLVDENKPAGNYEVTFNASSLSSGIYFYQLKAGSFNETKKMVLMK